MLAIFSAERAIALASLTVAFTSACASTSAQTKALIQDAETPLPLALAAREKGSELDEAAPPPRIPEESELVGQVDAEMLARIAIARSPALVAGARRVRAMAASARAESSLPEPRLAADIWQVPLSRPWAVGDAQMIMLSVSQTFPAPGVLGMREEAKAHEAKAEAKMVVASARELVRSVDQAFVDYVAATLRHRARLRYRDAIARMVELSKARLAAGASLSDIAQAEVELARADIDIATEERAIETARIRLNGLLAREANAPLGPPRIEPPSTTPMPLDEIVARARTTRPELEAAASRREAQALSARATVREAEIPEFTLGASYFPPSGGMREHGLGASVSMTLPWLSGAKRHGVTVEEERTAAATAEVDADRVRLGLDAATLAMEAKRAEQGYVLLGEKALPASLRAREAAEAGYVSGKSDALAWLLAARAVASVQLDIVMARASLDRALADLDFAAGGRLPREPLADFEGAHDER